jgi:hypothetical protein
MEALEIDKRMRQLRKDWIEDIVVLLTPEFPIRTLLSLLEMMDEYDKAANAMKPETLPMWRVSLQADLDQAEQRIRELQKLNKELRAQRARLFPGPVRKPGKKTSGPKRTPAKKTPRTAAKRSPRTSTTSK